MAIVPSAQFPGQIITGDPGYPLGRPRNVTVTGDGTGTPLRAQWVADLFGWQQALLDRASITPSGDPDQVGASDYMDALDALYPSIGRMNAAESDVTDAENAITALEGAVAALDGDITALEASRVTGPAGATDEAFARFDTATGKLLQDGVVKATNAGAVSGVTSLVMAGALTGATDITLSGEVKRSSGKSCEVLHRGGEINGYGWGERPVASFAGVVLPSCNQDSSYGNLRLHIPQGATITELRVFVHPGASRATPANRMQISLSRIAGISTSGVAGGALDSGFAAGTDAGTNVSQQVTLAGSHVHRAGDALYVTIVSGSTAAANPDVFYGVLAFYTENEIGGAQ